MCSFLDAGLLLSVFFSVKLLGVCVYPSCFPTRNSLAIRDSLLAGLSEFDSRHTQEFLFHHIKTGCGAPFQPPFQRILGGGGVPQS
jgi:hypothetical protein